MTDDGTPVSPASPADEAGVTLDGPVADGQIIEEQPEEPVAPEQNNAPPPVSLWQRLRYLVSGHPQAVDQRLDELEAAIKQHPDKAVNYILLGELYAEVREYTLAVEYLDMGLQLATRQVAAEDWGIIAQTLQDRALAGLTAAEAQLQRQNREKLKDAGKDIHDTAQ